MGRVCAVLTAVRKMGRVCAVLTAVGRWAGFVLF